jgi:dipeptidyl aminopeptidase/acylaminoacyl peptidase
VVCQGITFFGQNGQLARGLLKFGSVTGQVDPGSPWLNDLTATEPDWSPDGHHIVFVRPNPVGDRDIWIINAASSNPNDAIRVTHGPADDAHPRFSADGTKIFFISNRANRYGLNGIYDTERRGINIWTVARFDKP